MTETLGLVIALPWLPLLVGLCCLVDGFFPPVPSETAVVAALSLALTTPSGGWTTAWILAAAALGAAAGDSIAFWLGRRVGAERWRWMRTTRVRRALQWAAERLAARPATYVLAARYVPIGRVAVNMTAGATRLPYRRRFLPLSLVAAIGWAALTWAIATVASAWLGHAPLLAAGVGVAISLLLGLIVDVAARMVRWVRRRSSTRRPAQRLAPGARP